MRKSIINIAVIAACQVQLAGLCEAMERRIALVIGNGQYESVPRLPNPKSDATTVAESLKTAGFSSVTLVSDATREKIIRELKIFAGDSENADWAVVYYAGHGIEMNGVNYIIPVDAQLKTDKDLQFEAVPLQQIQASVEGARKLRLLILDACRDNPFASSMKKSSGSTRSIGRGLARVEPDAGTLVAYAAKDGQVAEDGNGEHSPFVTSLVKHIGTPGLELDRLFRKVTSDVLAATNKRQEPFTYGHLPDEDFYFIAPAAYNSAPIQEQINPAIAKPAFAPQMSSASVPERPASIPEMPSASPITEKPGTVIQSPSLGQATPQAKPVSTLATIDPVAPLHNTVKPAQSSVGIRPIKIPRKTEKHEPAVVRPLRVSQPVKRHEPPAAKVSRPHQIASRSRSAHCFVFNGDRVCE